MPPPADRRACRTRPLPDPMCLPMEARHTGVRRPPACWGALGCSAGWGRPTIGGLRLLCVLQESLTAGEMMSWGVAGADGGTRTRTFTRKSRFSHHFGFRRRPVSGWKRPFVVRTVPSPGSRRKHPSRSGGAARPVSTPSRRRCRRWAWLGIGREAAFPKLSPNLSGSTPRVSPRAPKFLPKSAASTDFATSAATRPKAASDRSGQALIGGCGLSRGLG